MIPGCPLGNMYFSMWSHNVIGNAVNLCASFKMGEYRKYQCHAPDQLNPPNETVKVPPKVIFMIQAYGTILGGFINYALMNSIVATHREILTDPNGDSFWTGASAQAYSTNAASWALAPHITSLVPATRWCLSA